MRKRFAVPAGLLGMLFGAVIGSPYLGNAGTSAAPGEPEFSCSMNSAIAPFVGCVAVGFLLGICIAHFVNSGVDRAVGAISLDGPEPLAAAQAVTPAPVRPAPAKPSKPKADPGTEGAPRLRFETPTPRPRQSKLSSRERPKPRPRQGS